jgi:YD repeat-containing protein
LPEIPYETRNTTERAKRLIEQSRILFRSNDLSRLLPLGQIETLAVEGETYDLAFNPSLTDHVYKRPNPDGDLVTLVSGDMMRGTDGSSGGYVDLEGNGGWWAPSGRVYYSARDIDPEDELAKARRDFFRIRRHCNPFKQSTWFEYDKGNLLLTRERDAVDNETSYQIDYRTLRPYLTTDPNGNRMQSAFDELGMMVGSAVMGKDGTNVGDSLAHFQPVLSEDEIDEYFADPKGELAARLLSSATTRVIYDFSRFWKSRKPIFLSTIDREIHSSDMETNEVLRTQVEFCYYDGLARQIQCKSQAEPIRAHDPEVAGVGLYWIGSGWTIYNNKGLPVRQFESFFDKSHDFTFHQEGVSPFIFYDPFKRPVAILNPDHTWVKFTFNAWEQRAYDENDMVLVNPMSDPDIAPYAKFLPAKSYLPTWYDARIDGQLGAEEQTAAQNTRLHANTPSTMYYDPLGRPFFTVYDNGPYGMYCTRTSLDIQGNPLFTTDAKGRIVVQYEYTMLGDTIYRASMEQGTKWMLLDVIGELISAWDNIHHFRMEYDTLRRPVKSYLRTEGHAEVLVGETVYGESEADPEARNLRTEIVRKYDQAGIATRALYDFKGNLLRTQRRFARLYKELVDWQKDVEVQEESYETAQTYDALNRPITTTLADRSHVSQRYDSTGLLQHIGVRTGNHTLPIVNNLEYNARLQRTAISYGNHVSSVYKYDPLTFRLLNLQTRRPPNEFPDDSPTPVGRPGSEVQNLRYTFDPVGNITHILDDAQQRIFFQDERVDPSHSYIYDPIYRLTSASGREQMP